MNVLNKWNIYSLNFTNYITPFGIKITNMFFEISFKIKNLIDWFDLIDTMSINQLIYKCLIIIIVSLAIMSNSF